MRTAIFCLPLILLCSCISKHKQEAGKPAEYYDIQGLIDEQINLLASISPDLHKKARIDGTQTTEELQQLDSAAWAKELGIFRTADINLPILSDSYVVSEDSGADGHRKRYISKNPGNTDVDSLVIDLLPKQNAPASITAALSSKNTLFTSQKTLVMEFGTACDSHVLKKYAINGWQKMASRDSTKFAIEGEIHFP